MTASTLSFAPRPWGVVQAAFLVGLTLAPALPGIAWAAEPTAISVKIPADKGASIQPGLKRLLVFAQPAAGAAAGEPRLGPNWFRPDPFFGLDVPTAAAGKTYQLDDSADSFPAPWSKLPVGKYRLQAVLDQKFQTQSFGNSPGNLFSKVVEWDSKAGAAPVLELTEVVPDEAWPKREFVEEVRFRSEMLTKFHGRTVEHRAGVILPKNYRAQPERRYPVIFIIPGFSGTCREALRYPDGTEAAPGEVDFIRVILDPQCGWGHHVFADSATNGPRGAALVQEFIPHLDQKYRTVADPRARFLTGHSSGGWSSLWLQVSQPETFGGTWSTSPDPVEFHDFQQVDLYAQPPQSMFVDAAGKRRPLARRDGQVLLWYQDFNRMDDVLKRGGQLRSFDAVFSPKGTDGEPLYAWNRADGQVDPAVTKAWEAYDIGLVLQRNWKTLGPKLAGKLHVFMGDQDTFYLEGATIRLKTILADLGSDAQITIKPGADHSLPPEWLLRIRKEMSESYQKSFPASVK